MASTRRLFIASGLTVGACALVMLGWLTANKLRPFGPSFAKPSNAPPMQPLQVVDGEFRRDSERIRFNGDAAWSLIVRPTGTEARQYLKTRQSQGFNAILVNLIEHEVGGPENASGDRPFGRFGLFARPNERYFEHADRVLADAAELGITVFLAPAYIGYECGNEGWCAELKSESADVLFDYGRYLGTRYRNFNNIVWVHGGDADARRFGLEGKVAVIAAGIRAAGGSQLHTAHCARNFSGGECYPFLALDFDTVYASCTTTAQEMAEFHALRRGRPSTPFVYIEGTYENMGETPHCMRDQLLLALLGGASGHVFGNQPIWDFAAGWQDALTSDAARTVTTLWTMLDQIGHNFEAGAGAPGSIASAHDRERNVTVIYAQRATRIELPQGAVGPQMVACSIDLTQRAPAFTQAWGVDCTASNRKSLPAPHESDWLVAIAPAATHPWRSRN